MESSLKYTETVLRELCKATGTLINAVTYITPTLQNMRLIMCEHCQFSLEIERIQSSSPTSTLSSGPEVLYNHEQKRFGNWYGPKDVKTEVHLFSSIQFAVSRKAATLQFFIDTRIAYTAIYAVQCTVMHKYGVWQGNVALLLCTTAKVG